MVRGYMPIPPSDPELVTLTIRIAHLARLAEIAAAEHTPVTAREYLADVAALIAAARQPARAGLLPVRRTG